MDNEIEALRGHGFAQKYSGNSRSWKPDSELTNIKPVILSLTQVKIHETDYVRLLNVFPFADEETEARERLLPSSAFCPRLPSPLV